MERRGLGHINMRKHEVLREVVDEELYRGIAVCATQTYEHQVMMRAYHLRGESDGAYAEWIIMLLQTCVENEGAPPCRRNRNSTLPQVDVSAMMAVVLSTSQ